MKKRIDITGQKFGRLTVVKMIYQKWRPSRCLCKCECGNEKIVDARKLIKGQTKSCGCLKREINKIGTKNISKKKKETKKAKRYCKSCGTPLEVNYFYCDYCLKYIESHPYPLNIYQIIPE